MTDTNTGNSWAGPNVTPYDYTRSPNWMLSPTETGGQSAVNPQANAFDYGQINQFADAAYKNQMRYLQPQMQLQDERFSQDLINRGIDPNSEAGQKAFQQKAMGQNDALSNAAYGAMGFGAGLQQQMFGQDQARSQLANALLQSQMGLTQRGLEHDNQMGLAAGNQAFGQMMNLEGLNYRDYQTFVDQSRYQDSLAMALAGLAPGPQYSQINTGMQQAPYYDYASQIARRNNLWGG